jgi:cobalt-zinc-cadmium efflux system protein
MGPGRADEDGGSGEVPGERASQTPSGPSTGSGRAEVGETPLPNPPPDGEREPESAETPLPGPPPDGERGPEAEAAPLPNPSPDEVREGPSTGSGRADGGAHGHAVPGSGGRGPRAGRRLLLALGVSLSTVAAQVVGGWLTGSLAILADALHTTTDASALGLALVAVHLARRPHTPELTFGWHRAEVLAATFNAFLLLVIAAFVTWHAIGRLVDPRDVHGIGLLGVALFGLGANAVAFAILHGLDSVNVRAARLHVLSDLGGSLAAVTAGVVIALTGWMRADPLLSLLIVALVTVAALRLAWETAGILMARTPRGLDLAEVNEALRQVPGVVAVHDVHAWTVTSGFEVFVAHVEVLQSHDALAVVEECVRVMRERFGLDHVAIHPELARLQTVVVRDERTSRVQRG